MRRTDRLAELEERVDDGDARDRPGVTVEWRDAAPTERPQGVAWDADDRTLSYDLWSAQRTAIDALAAPDVDLVGLLGGYRAGKSITGARWLLSQALAHPGERFLCMGIDFAKATGSTYRVLFEQLPPMDVRTDLITSGVTGPELSPLVVDYHRSDHRLVLFNDSVIKLGAADTWARHAGDEFAAAWLDEPSHYKDLHNILEMVGSRLTAKAGPKKQFWTLTGNGFNAAWKILDLREDEDGDPIGLDIDTVTADVRNNPYLDEADVQRLERQFAGTGREEQALSGGFAAATGLVYGGFSREEHVIPHSRARELIDDGERWFAYGYDAGWKDPRVVVAAGKSAYGQLVIFDEWYAGESHVEDAIRWLDGTDKPRGTVFCEHVPTDIDKFKAAGWHAVKAKKDLDAGISEVRDRLGADGDADDDDRPGLLVSDRCENLIREFLGYKREHVGTSVAEDHCLDATRYLIMGEATVGEPSVGVAFG